MNRRTHRDLEDRHTMGITLARDGLKPPEEGGPSRIKKKETNFFFYRLEVFEFVFFFFDFLSRGAQPQPRRASALFKDSPRRHGDTLYEITNALTVTIML